MARTDVRNTASPRLWLYGRHAVAAALSNPARRVRRILATKNAADWLTDQNIDATNSGYFEDARPADIDRALPAGAVHQGLAAQVFDLERVRLKDICANPSERDCVLVLDQITDPQNIGAIFRSAAAFGAQAIIVQDRRTPPLSAVLAKAAAGAVERLPCVRAVNIARSIEALQGLGYHCAGLAGHANSDISTFPNKTPLAFVLGAEGAGLRPLVAKTCDGLYRIAINDHVESLNVSNAAAITLHEARRCRIE